MNFQYNHYIWPLVASAIASLSLGLYAQMKRRNANGALSFILSMFVLTLWSTANVLEVVGMDLTTKIFWVNVQYFAYCYSPVTLLALCMELTGHDKWVRNRKILWLGVIPAITIILVWTNGLHGLINYDIYIDYSDSFPVIKKKYGPLFFVHSIYSELINIFAWVLLVKAAFSKNIVYKRQALSLLLGLSLIISANILHITGLSPVKKMDITPLTFAPAGLIAAWGIFRFKLFDVIPIAWATVIRTMDAGVIVLDLQDRILDVNPYFEKIIGIAASMASAKKINEVCGNIPEFVTAYLNRSITHAEFYVETKEKSKVYEVFLSTLTDSKKVAIGRLAVVYDITEIKQKQQALLEQQWRLAVSEEREHMARDMHDNLGQMLGFINFQAQGIKQELLNEGLYIASYNIEKLLNATQMAHNEIRAYICNIRNSVYKEKDFLDALKKVILDFEEQSGINIKFDMPRNFTGEKFKPDTWINVLNIVKESLNNIRKHAQANFVLVEFFYSHGHLCVSIDDDGMGFEINQPIRGNKFGLSIMQERAAKIGAEIKINSIIGKGSRIELHIPISEGRKEI